MRGPFDRISVYPRGGSSMSTSSAIEYSAALDLLSLEGSEGADSSEKAKEILLAATILHSKTSHWKHKVIPYLTTITHCLFPYPYIYRLLAILLTNWIPNV